MNATPYGFQPIDTTQAVHDTPLWRDGSSSETRLSGEILVTLTAKTPLVVGNHQHKLDGKHSVLTPQMLDDGRVLLGATSLKGMLRSAMASLLQAPMERVAEHHYTYRPNLGFDLGTEPKREQRAAVIKKIEGEGPAAKITIALLEKNCPVAFIREEAKKELGDPEAGQLIQRTVQDVMLTGESPRMRLEKKAKEQQMLDHLCFVYRGGIDGTGQIARAFNKKSHVYDAVLVPACNYRKAGALLVPEKVLGAYYQTQAILADPRYGHLNSAHPLAKQLNLEDTQKAILDSTPLQVNQLIYVEIEHGVTPTGKAGILIRSMGHHFQYRWGYTSSLRYRNRLLDGKGELRSQLALHPEETATENGSPKQLTASRLIFGYAIDEQAGEQEKLATGHFKRLAGRIAFNTAIEDPTGKTMEERFMEGGKEIQLRILGLPRPSAVEFYLKQTALPKKLTTYGDLPGEPGGDLAGRKFYRHQPDAKSESRLYAPSTTEKQANSNTEERGNCVRYLSRPGSRFRTTLRFDSLRPWELGALLAALDPSLVEPLFGLPRHSPGYAHKLGYGKPLGLGSVTLDIDKARWQQNDNWHWQQASNGDADWHGLLQTCLAALKEKLQVAWGEKAKDPIIAWLKPRRWSESGRANYPTLADKKGETTIFNFHTNLRRNHAAARRGANKDFRALEKLLEIDA